MSPSRRAELVALLAQLRKALENNDHATAFYRLAQAEALVNPAFDPRQVGPRLWQALKQGDRGAIERAALAVRQAGRAEDIADQLRRGFARDLATGEVAASVLKQFALRVVVKGSAEPSERRRREGLA